MSKPLVSDPKLYKIVNTNYRENASIGSGSIADAVRHEFKTGQLVGGKSHAQKAQNQIDKLKSWLKNTTNASAGDIRTAQNMIVDMEDALATPKP